MVWAHTCGSWRAGDYQIAGSRELDVWEKPFALFRPIPAETDRKGHHHGRGLSCLGTYDTLEEAQQAARVFEANKVHDDGSES
jgi:hypothetical protein